jgi:predicted dehydrogenase
MSKLRAAVVGVGYLGNFHAQKYKALSEKTELNTELVAVCDLHLPQAQKVAESLQVQAFSKPQDLIGKIDAVTIATVTPAHFELSQLFLKNGIHVNVEKPICLSSSEAQILVDLAQSKKLTLCVGHSERFNPAFRELQQMVKKPLFIEFNRYAPFKSRGSDVSVLHDLMIHDLDLMLAMDSSKCRLLSAQSGKLITNTDDWCSASFEFESGLRAQINSSRVAKEMIRTIRATDSQNLWVANLQTGELEQTKGTGNSETPVSHQVHNTGRGDNLLTETEAFLRAIQGLSNDAIRGDAGLKALQWVEKILDFVQTRRGA